MSIVEKALGKVQGKPVSDDHLLSEGGRGGDVHRLAPREEHKPHLKIEVDREKLRSLQMTPPADQSLRLTNELRRIKRPLLEPLLAATQTENGEAIRRELVVMSSVPNEGKTFITLNLALSIASERDCKVLLVDGDLAKPHLTSLLGQSDVPGLTDILADDSRDPFEHILDTSVDGLWFLPAGKPNPNAPELVASRRMRQVCKIIAARDPRRIVLFDSPPVLASNEAQALCSHIQNILLVVRADYTSPETLADTLRVLGEKRISCVLNRTPQSATSPFYGTYGVYGSNSS